MPTAKVDIPIEISGNAPQQLAAARQAVQDLIAQYGTLKNLAQQVNVLFKVTGQGSLAQANQNLAAAHQLAAQLPAGVTVRYNTTVGQAPPPVPTFQQRINEAMRQRQEREALEAEIRRRTPQPTPAERFEADVQAALRRRAEREALSEEVDRRLGRDLKPIIRGYGSGGGGGGGHRGGGGGGGHDGGAMKAYRQHHRGLIQGPYGIMQGVLQGDLGATIAATGPAALGVGAYYALTVGIGKSAEAMDAFQDETKTSAQKLRALGETFLPGAQAINHLIDALDGTANRLKMADLGFQRQGLLQQQRYQLGHLTQQNEAETAHYQARAAAFAAVPLMTAPTFDRDTRAGEQAYRDWAALVPYRGAAARARAELEAVTRERSASGARQAALERVQAVRDRDARTAIQHRKDVERYEETTGIRSQASRQEAGYAAEMAVNEALNHRKLLLEEIQRQHELGVRQAEAESAIRKADLATARQKLAILEAKEQRMTADTRRLGGMSKYERQLGLQATKMVAQYGADNVPLDIRRRAEQFAPDYVFRREEAAARQSPEYKEGQRLDFFDRGNIKDVREQISQAKVTVENRIVFDESETARRLAQELRPFFGTLLREVISQMRDEAKKQEEELIRKYYNN